MEKNARGKSWRHSFRAGLIVTLLLFLTGCVLKITEGVIFTDGNSTYVHLGFKNVSVGKCISDLGPNTDTTTFNCGYRTETGDGSTNITSTGELISEFGLLLGLLIDPVIVQVPDSAIIESATVDDGNGPQPLRITETYTFDVQPGVQSTAESGKKFWIIELPVALEASIPSGPPDTGPQFNYTFNFQIPGPPSDYVVPIKAMYAGRVEVGGATFYIPLYPCTTDFAQVPEIRLPVTEDLSGLIFDLLFQFMNNENLGCQGEVYDFRSLENPDPFDQFHTKANDIQSRLESFFDLLLNAKRELEAGRISDAQDDLVIAQDKKVEIEALVDELIQLHAQIATSLNCYDFGRYERSIGTNLYKSQQYLEKTAAYLTNANEKIAAALNNLYSRLAIRYTFQSMSETTRAATGINSAIAYIERVESLSERGGTIVDADGDGYAPIACGGEDCDDNDPFIKPEGIEELCFDGKDNDCDDAIDCSDSDCFESCGGS